MKTLPWFIAAFGIGAIALIINAAESPKYATSSGTLEDAARKASNWGTRQRVRGAGGRFVGKLKQGIGQATGSASMADEGTDQSIAGALQNAAGQVAEAAGKTIHDMNV